MTMRSPTPPSPGQERWDRLGVWASIACTAHCLAAPFLFLFAPAFARFWAHPGSHALIATLVLPLAWTVLQKGYRLHGRRWVANTTRIGISLILLGCVLPYLNGDSVAAACTECCPRLVETQAGTYDLQLSLASVASVLGSLFLITAHVGNMACSRKCCDRPGRGD